MTLGDLYPDLSDLFKRLKSDSKNIDKLSRYYGSQDPQLLRASFGDGVRKALEDVKIFGFEIPRRQLPFIVMFVFGLLIYAIKSAVTAAWKANASWGSALESSESIFTLSVSTPLSRILCWLVVPVSGVLLLLPQFGLFLFDYLIIAVGVGILATFGLLAVNRA